MAYSQKDRSNELPKVVAEVGKISISGNIVPPLWFKTITFGSGKPDTNAILILSDILYWYRPTEVRNEQTGALVGYRKKFHEDLLRRSYADFKTQFGLSDKQIRECLIRLENIGAIRRVFRTIHSSLGRQNNVMYIDLVPSVVNSLTHTIAMPFGENDVTAPLSLEGSTSLLQRKQVLPLKETRPSLEGNISFPERKHLLPSKETAPSLEGNISFPGGKDHIETNISSEITSNTSSLSSFDSAEQAEMKQGREKESIPGKMLLIWNTLVPEKTTSANKFLSTQLEKALQDQLEGKLENWDVVCRNFKMSRFLMGESDKISFKPTLSWLVNPRESRVANVFLKSQWTFDDRESSGKASVDLTALNASIDLVNEPEICKQVRRFVCQHNPAFYQGYFRNATLETSGNKVLIFASLNFCQEKIEETFGPILRDFLKHKMALEINGPKKRNRYATHD